MHLNIIKASVLVFFQPGALLNLYLQRCTFIWCINAILSYFDVVNCEKLKISNDSHNQTVLWNTTDTATTDTDTTEATATTNTSVVSEDASNVETSIRSLATTRDLQLRMVCPFPHRMDWEDA